jgi:hypothetical protein
MAKATIKNLTGGARPGNGAGLPPFEEPTMPTPLNTHCTCTATRACDAYHEIRVDGLTHHDLRAFVAEHPGEPARAHRRYHPDGTVLSERVAIENVAMECGLDRHATDADALRAMGAR